MFKNHSQKTAKDKLLYLNPDTSGNSPQPLTAERLDSSQKMRGVGVGPQAKYTGSAQVNNTREKPPEIYSAQIWQVFHNWKWFKMSLWRWMACWCLIATLVFAVLWFKHTLSNASEVFSSVSNFANFCRSSASFMWYFSLSMRQSRSLITECKASFNRLNSLQHKRETLKNESTVMNTHQSWYCVQQYLQSIPSLLQKKYSFIYLWNTVQKMKIKV